MSFVTPALLGGIALVAIPIALHLVMRRQPKKLPFPALQFVRKRQQSNRRRMNLRHWFLLALRCLIIAGMAIALARPTIKGSGLRGKEGAPLAVALVVDNSLRMQYLQNNETRQQKATDMAQWLVKRLPEDAEVAIVDRSRATSGFAVDLATAESRLKNLEVESNPRQISNIVREAINLATEKPDYRQEVFLFSDLNATDWDQAAIEAVKESLAEAPDVRMYVVDVGVEEPKNLSLGQIEMRHNTLRPGQSLQLSVPVSVSKDGESPLVELYVEDSSGNPVKRGQRLVESSEKDNSEVTFEIGELPLGTHQGFVRLAANDPLEVDNTRYFTVEVRPPARVLLLGEKEQDTLFLREAICPALIANHDSVRFECDTSIFSQASTIDLNEYAAVCLLDPPPLSEKFWETLADYTNDGGGVGIFLGHRARLEGFNNSSAQQFLPGLLKLRSRYATFLFPRTLAHPALAGLRDYSANIPWAAYPVWKYWEFSDMAADAYVVMRYNNNQPALLERPLGQGRVLTFTTPISDPLEPIGRDPWNILPTGPEPWPFVALANQLMGYLTQNENDSLDYLAGETVNLQLSANKRISNFVLYQPAEDPIRNTLPPGEDTIRIGTTRQLGNYRIASGGSSNRLQMGFSVNAPEEVSRLERVEIDPFKAAVDSKQFKLAQDLDDVKTYVDIGRSGRELYSWAITLVALVWSSEYLLANRFYRSTS